MIFGEAKVLGPYGLVPIKELKVGDPVWSFGRGACQTNRVRSIERGMTRQAVTIRCPDVPTTIRVARNAAFWFPQGNKAIAGEMKAGDGVVACEGAEVYKTVVGPVMYEDLAEPEEVFRLEVMNGPHNILANGVLCRA